MAATGNMSYYYKRKITELALGGQDYNPVTGTFIQLYQSAVDFTATGGVPGGIGLRYSATNNLETWRTGLTASGTGYTWNTIDLQWPTATADWGTAQYFLVLDAAANGNALYWGEMVTAKVVGSGDVFRFPSGQLVFTLT